MMIEYESKYFEKLLDIYHRNLPLHKEEDLKKYLDGFISQKSMNFKVIIEDDNIIGFVIFRIIESEKKLLLEELHIDLDMHSLGYGKEALSEIISIASRLKLDTVQLYVLTENIKAISFYLRFGFSEVKQTSLNDYKELFFEVNLK